MTVIVMTWLVDWNGLKLTQEQALIIWDGMKLLYLDGAGGEGGEGYSELALELRAGFRLGFTEFVFSNMSFISSTKQSLARIFNNFKN